MKIYSVGPKSVCLESEGKKITVKVTKQEPWLRAMVLCAQKALPATDRVAGDMADVLGRFVDVERNV